MQKVKNRGISGDVTTGVLNRLGEIYHFKPVSVFILIGINDLSSSLSPAYVGSNILKIADLIHKKSPCTKIYVQTILPTTRERLTAKIQEVNKILLHNVNAGTYSLIDLHVLFSDEKDRMKSEYTKDGLHLSEAGYQLWVDLLKQYMEHADD